MSENPDRSLADVIADAETEDRALTTAAVDAAEMPAAPSLLTFLRGSTAVRRAVTICTDGGLVTETDVIREALTIARATDNTREISALKRRYEDTTRRRLAASLRWEFEGHNEEWVTSTRRRYFDREGVKYTIDRQTSALITAEGSDTTAVQRALIAQMLDQLVTVHTVTEDGATGGQLDVDDLTVADVEALYKILPSEVNRLFATCSLANGQDPAAAMTVDF